MTLIQSTVDVIIDNKYYFIIDAVCVIMSHEQYTLVFF